MERQYLDYEGLERLNKHLQIQFTSLPEPSLANLNKIVQYIGASTVDYTNGSFYKCVSDGAASPTFSWKPFDDAECVISGYYNTLNGKFYNESTFVTEIPGDVNAIFIDLFTNVLYRYNEVGHNYIALTAGTSPEIVDVFELPSTTDIENKIYEVSNWQTTSIVVSDANIASLTFLDDLSETYTYPYYEVNSAYLAKFTSDSGLDYSSFMAFDHIAKVSNQWFVYDLSGTSYELTDGNTIYFISSLQSDRHYYLGDNTKHALYNLNPTLSLNNNSDVSLSNLGEGDILQYDDTNEEWVNVPNSLGNITNVNLTNLQNGDRIKYDSQSDSWINGPGAKSDWANDNPTDDSYIVNKPTLGSAASANSTNSAIQGSNDVLTSGGAYTLLAGKANAATSISGYGITDAYTKTEIEELFAEHENNVSWKTAVATYADIATTYPNPQEGWTVCCTDTNIVWRYSGGQWVQISANTIPVATTSENGLMSSAMVTKLNGIAAGAEVNQNTFSNVKVGTTTVSADGKTDTLELVGSNVTLTPDATNDKVTIGITKGNVTSALGYTPPTSDTNTHRPIQMNGTQILGDNVTALNLKAGSNVSLSNSSGTVTIAATNSTYPDAIKNITRSGTTFTATRYSGSTFTFTQQDNNTTTGTTYAAGSCPNNTTFATQGSVYNVYAAMKNNAYWYARAEGTSSARISYNTNVVRNYTNCDLQVQYYRGIARISCGGINLNMPNQWAEYLICSGLPVGIFGQNNWSTMQGQNTNNSYACYVTLDGKLYIRTDGTGNGNDLWLRGDIIYFTQW